MRIVLANRARMSTSAAGTGTWTLSGAVAGHQTFADGGIADGDKVYYAAENDSRTEWEVGRGTYTSSGSTLTRDAIFDNSNGDTSAVNFTNPPQVWVDAPAQIFRFRRRTVTASGGITVNVDTDDLIVVNKTVGAATAVTLPSAVNRLRPLTIKDGKGDADTNNITITPNGVETIDGQSTWLINFAYGAVTLDPKDDGTGWLII